VLRADIRIGDNDRVAGDRWVEPILHVENGPVSEDAVVQFAHVQLVRILVSEDESIAAEGDRASQPSLESGGILVSWNCLYLRLPRKSAISAWRDWSAERTKAEVCSTSAATKRA
jgi:hypothetical protein